MILSGGNLTLDHLWTILEGRTPSAAADRAKLDAQRV
jgi:hypothetical protein